MKKQWKITFVVEDTAHNFVKGQPMDLCDEDSMKDTLSDMQRFIEDVSNFKVVDSDVEEGKEKLKMERVRCHDCCCLEGELHDYGCDMERCPFCEGQLISCGCCYEKLHIDCREGTYTYLHGLTDKQQEKWIEILDRKGRIPYVEMPVVCKLCGKLYPIFFRVGDNVWKKYVIPLLQDTVLCEECYNRMKELFPNGWRKADAVKGGKIT